MSLQDWQRRELIELGTSHMSYTIGTPYRWGGDDPINGFDCSGLVMEYLKTIGLAQENEDMSSATMAKTFAKRLKPEDYEAGDIVCFASKSKPKTVNHVGLITDHPQNGLPTLILEAGGGGSTTLDEQIAAKQNAYVRVRPLESILNRGKVLVCVVNPFEKVVGK